MYMKTLNRFCDVLESFCKILIVLIFIVITFSAFMQVFSRNLMSGSMKWTDELCRFCLVWLAFMSAAIGVRKNAHLAIDVVVNLLPGPAQRFLAKICFVCIAAFGGLLLHQGGVLSSNTINQLSTVLGIRMGLIYLAMPISGFFMLVFAANAFANAFSPAAKAEDK